MSESIRRKKVRRRTTQPGGKRQDRLNKALDRLAALYPFGALLAATAPDDFLNQVADEIERLRAKQ